MTTSDITWLPVNAYGIRTRPKPNPYKDPLRQAQGCALLWITRGWLEFEANDNRRQLEFIGTQTMPKSCTQCGLGTRVQRTDATPLSCIASASKLMPAPPFDTSKSRPDFCPLIHDIRARLDVTRCPALERMKRTCN